MKLPKSTLIYFYFLGVVPIGLVSFGNLDPYKIVIILIYALTFLFSGPLSARIKEDKALRIPSYVILTLLGGIGLAYVHMLLTTERMSSIFLWFGANYIFFWVLNGEIKSFEDLNLLFRRLGWLVGIALVLLILFYLKPDLLTGPLYGAGMGSFREYIRGFPRIFTPGMLYIVMGAIYALTRITFGYDTLKRKAALAASAIIAFVAVAVICSVRTYVIGIALTALVLLFYRFNVKKAVAIGTIAVAIIGTVMLLPGDYSSYIKDRVGNVASVNMLDLKGALGGNVTYGQAQFETYYWRVSEAVLAINLIDSWNEKIFGAMGSWYQYGPDYSAVQPHISYATLYYSSGLAGLVVFGVFIIYFSVKFYRVVRLYRGHPFEYVAVFVALIWLNMLIIAAINPVFYIEDNIILISSAALAIVLERLKLVGDKGPRKLN